MEPVGELDEHDADVLGHRQEHLPDVLGLLLLVAVGAELGQLGDAVHEVGDLGPEPLLDVGEGVLGVLRDVVEQRRRDRDRIDPELGEDLGRRERMGDVRLAGGPDLHAVGLDGEVERPLDHAQVGLCVGLAERGEQPGRYGLASNGTSAWPTGPRSATGWEALAARLPLGGAGPVRGTSGSRTTGSGMRGSLPGTRAGLFRQPRIPIERSPVNRTPPDPVTFTDVSSIGRS